VLQARTSCDAQPDCTSSAARNISPRTSVEVNCTASSHIPSRYVGRVVCRIWTRLCCPDVRNVKASQRTGFDSQANLTERSSVMVGAPSFVREVLGSIPIPKTGYSKFFVVFLNPSEKCSESILKWGTIDFSNVLSN
jgi:hypothetical protein